MLYDVLNSKNKWVLFPRTPTIISSFVDDSNCEKAGLLVKDRIVAINGVSVNYFDLLKNELLKYKDTVVAVDVIRGGEKIVFNTKIDEFGEMGFRPANLSVIQLEDLGVYTLASTKYSFLESFPAGYAKAVKKLKSYIDQFILILSPSTGAYKGLGGFGAIWEAFWTCFGDWDCGR